MIREKFIDRLRQKYQYAGFKGGSTVTPSIEESIKPSIRPISNISQTQDMPEREKALSFLSKGLKYAAPLIKGGQNRLGQLAAKSLGPLSLMLGATKAYGGNVYDPVTGVHKYTGETFGTPFQSGGLRSAYETPSPDSNVVGQSRKSLAEIRRLERDQNRYLQSGGMYDQMQQYQTGGVDENEDREWKSYYPMEELYTEEEIEEIEKEDEREKKYGPRHPFTNIKWDKETNQPIEPQQTGGMYDQIRQYQGGGISDNTRVVKPITTKVLDLSDRDLDKIKSIADSKWPQGWRQTFGLPGAVPSYANEKTLQALYNRADSTGRIDRDYYIGLGHIQKNSNWNPKYSSETQGIQPMSREEFNDIIDKKQTGGMYDQMRQYQQGGMQLPGGEMNPIPGSDAVEFTGASHDEGGIMLDPQTEVEDGETMDQVTVAKHGGKRGDYFFSSYLKKGGRSFADMHKDILRNGGDQQEIDWLAKMQEKAAGRDAKKVGKAKLGGMMKYQSGGEAAGPAYVYTTSDATRDYNQYLKDMQFNPSDPDYDATGILNFEDWSEQQGLVHQGPTETRDFAAEDEAARKAQFESDLDLYDKALKRDVPLGAYVAGATQLVPAAYSLLHKQPAAEQTEFTPGFTHPIVAERGKASKLQRVNYNVERARNAADMRAINKYIETSGGGPANIINKMMAYSKKQEGDAKIAAAETRANTAIANQEAQMAQQMELSNLQRAQQAATTNAQLAAQEAARADQVEELNARRRQQRIDDMEYMKYQGIDATAQGIAGIIGDALSYKAQEKLAKVIGPEGVYDRAKAIDIFLKEINPATGKLYTREQAADKVRDIYNYYNPKEDKDES